jgi:hypothetical protein
MADEVSTPGLATPDSEYTLTVEDALERYNQAGHPWTARSVRRFCAEGRLDCRRIETKVGDKYLISSTSVAKHIAYLEKVRPTA